MNEFIITFRETLEAALIVGIIYTLLSKQDLTEQIRHLWMAVIAAVIVSIIVALSLNEVKDSIGNVSIEKLVEAIFMYITAGLLWYVIFWLAKHVSNRKELEGQTNSAIKTSSYGIFFLVFFAILREGFETAIFLLGSFSILGSFSYIGFILGMTLAILLGYLVVIQGRRLDLRKFFRLTTLLLVFLASGMVAYGTHEAEEFLVKGEHLEWVGIEDKSQIDRVWDVLKPKEELLATDNDIFYTYGNGKYTHLLHDKGQIGVFLKGFFGYNSNPNWVELILWFLSMLIGLNLWRRFYLTS
jgi:high-affinity iron transporter